MPQTPLTILPPSSGQSSKPSSASPTPSPSPQDGHSFVVDVDGDPTVPATCLLDEVNLSEDQPNHIGTLPSEDQAETTTAPESSINHRPQRHERFARLAQLDMEMDPATQSDKDAAADEEDSGAGKYKNKGSEPTREDPPAEIGSAGPSKAEALKTSAPATFSTTVAKTSFTPDDLADYLGQLSMPKEPEAVKEMFEAIGPSTDASLIMHPGAAKKAVDIWTYAPVDDRTPLVFQEFLCPPPFPYCGGELVQYDFKLSDLKTDIVEVSTIEAGVASGKHWNIKNLTLDSYSSPRADGNFPSLSGGSCE